MSFAWPHLLWLLAVPLGVLVLELTRRRRSAAASTHPKILRAEAGARSLEFKGAGDQPVARAKPRVWLCIGLAFAILALARPQWGRLEEPVFDQSREILLAMDLSRSMLTPDVKPSRLERSKLLIQSLLEKLQGERVGLAVFSGTSFLQSPLSADYEILREFLPALGPDFLPEGGTNYHALIETAISAFGTSNAADRFLIILSDGEATENDWKELLPELKKKGIRVIGLGIGTTGGGMIPDGTGGFVKDERGAVVLSKLESSTLQELAQATGGVYRDSSSWLDLASLIKETVEAGQKGKFVEKNTVRLVERFQWPLALGLWCLLVSLFYEFPVRPRPRDVKLATPNPGFPKSETAKLAATAALVLLVTCHLSLVTRAAEAAPSSPAAPLSKIVGRLAAAAEGSARDWSELGHETVIWGSHLQGEQQQVPEGPVRDALAAVDTGAKLDPKATDWEKLRQDLEALLQKPEEQKQDKKDQKQNDQQKQDQKDQQKQDQNQQNQQQKSDQQQQQDKKDQQQQKSDQQKQNADDQKKPGESAFGDMQKKDQPPPPPQQDSGTQKVGGAPEKKDQPPESADPSLALPLQKLDQLRNQDSPAQLFQLMDGDKKPSAKKPGKDW